MRALVTGATGLVGNNLVRLLLERGHEVRALTRERSDSRPLAGLDVERIAGDVRDPAAAHRACHGVSHVFHAAAKVHIGLAHLRDQLDINVEGTRHITQGCVESGARLIHVSGVDTLNWGTRDLAADEDTPLDFVDPDPYPRTKREAEKIVLDRVRQGVLDAVVVYPTFMLGPWDWKPSSGRMLLTVAHDEPLVAPPGSNDFADVRDVAEAMIQAANIAPTGERYILGGGTISYMDAWTTMARVTGARPPLMRVTNRMVRIGGWAGDIWGKLWGQEPDLNSASAAAALRWRNVSSAKARRELNLHSRPFESTVRDTWNWFEVNGYVAPKRRILFTRIKLPAKPVGGVPKEPVALEKDVAKAT